MLDRRKAAVLRAIVREYVRTGQPVGSKTLADRGRIKASSATIRNDMALLEELGYIRQPYTSAGRIPTDVGYRWFIDNWPGTTWPDLPDRDQSMIDEMMHGEVRGLDEALEETSHVLSEVTHSTAVVVAPPARKDLFARLELLRRDSRRATLLMIADTGEVGQGIVEFTKEKSEAELTRLASSLSDELRGASFEEAPAVIRTSMEGSAPDPDRERIAQEVETILSTRFSDRIFRGGTSNMLSPDKFPDLSTAQDVVEALEQPVVLTRLIEAARQAQSMLIFIGREVPVEKMQACAVVFAPYDVGADRQGALGVVGPTRMDYPHTISAVEQIAHSLSNWLNFSD